MNIVRYWDLTSLFVFCFQACLGTFCLYQSKKIEQKRGKKIKLNSIYYWVWWLVWTLLAASRLVNSNYVGGTDAYHYAIAFENVLNPNYLSAERMEHYGKMWEMMCKAIQIISDNYHVFFLFIHGFIAYAYILFLNEFALTSVNYIPFIVVFFPYLIGYCSLRTAVTIALVLLCVVCLKKNRPILCIPLAILSVGFQSSSALYILFIPFYYIFKRNKITLKKGIIFTSGSALIGMVIRRLFSSGLISIKYYDNYAERSYTTSFFDSYWKIILGQLLLAIMIFILKKKIFVNSSDYSEEDQNRIQFIWLMCLFDLMLIPLAYYISMWRAWQYFCLARLVMWGEIVRIGKYMVTKDSRRIYQLLVVSVFLAYFVLYVHSNWLNSGLTPYIFAPFFKL